MESFSRVATYSGVQYRAANGGDAEICISPEVIRFLNLMMGPHARAVYEICKVRQDENHKSKI